MYGVFGVCRPVQLQKPWERTNQTMDRRFGDRGWEVLGHSYCRATYIKTQVDDVRMACV
jgi:hypothetical protein